MFRQSICLNFLIFVTLLLTIFISSCSKKEQKLLKDEKFVEVLTDLMIVENLSIQESERIKLVQQVFKKHQIDSSLFYETRRRRTNNEKYWIKIYTKVKERVKAKMDSIQTKQNMPAVHPPKSD